MLSLIICSHQSKNWWTYHSTHPALNAGHQGLPCWWRLTVLTFLNLSASLDVADELLFLLLFQTPSLLGFQDTNGFFPSIFSLAKHSRLLYYLFICLTSRSPSTPGFGSLPSVLTPWGILLVLEPSVSWMIPQMYFPSLLSFLTSRIIYLTTSSCCHLHVLLKFQR